MKDINTLLEEHKLNRFEIEELIRQNRRIEAIKIVRDQTNWDLKNSKDFVEAIEGNQTHFSEENNLTSSSVSTNVSVKMLNQNGKLIFKVKHNNEREKVVFPTDPDWTEVKKAMGNNVELLAYEKDYLENPNKYQHQKNTLFIEENHSNKWKFVLLASVIALAIIYFIYSKS